MKNDAKPSVYFLSMREKRVIMGVIQEVKG